MSLGLQPGQIPCPSCGQSLALPIEAVLAAQPIVCAGCGLELTASQDASSEALTRLGEWYRDTQAARAAMQLDPGSASRDDAPRRRRRPRR